MRFRESRTAHNLLVSFSAEAQARTRYNFFAMRAREENFIQISRIFDETAEQEYEHALRFFKFFNGGELEISGRFPSGVIEGYPFESAVRCRTGTLRTRHHVHAVC